MLLQGNEPGPKETVPSRKSLEDLGRMVFSSTVVYQGFVHTRLIYRVFIVVILLPWRSMVSCLSALP